MTQTIHTHRFDNGLVLLAECMDWLESAAFCLLLPSGSSRDPQDLPGIANFVCEMVQRGCGNRDSRAFVDDLEMLGADTSASVSNAHTGFGGAMPAESIYETLSIYADVVRKPHLPEAELEDGRLVCLQEVRSVEDNLPQKMFQQLRARRYDDPYGRSTQGTFASVAKIGIDDVRAFFGQSYGPQDAILSVAGKVDWPRLRDHVEACFADWPAHSLPELIETPAAGGYQHLPHESNQTHIGIACPNVFRAHPDYFLALGAVEILSGGMSSRLFTEVREKRGLCYDVSAFLDSLKDRGSILCYAGSTTDRAQETLDVIIAELRRLSDGVNEAELARVKTSLKSHLVMQQESSSVRSRSMAAHWYFLGRIQPIEELQQIIDALTCEQINRFLADYPLGDFTIVTLGAEQLEVPVGVS